MINKINIDIKEKQPMKEKIEQIKKITNNKICNHCLGRKFIEDINETENNKRGEIIKTKHKLDKNNPEECYICNGIFEKIPQAITKTIQKIEYLDLEFNSFIVGSKVSEDILLKDEELNKNINLETENIKKELNRELGKQLETILEPEVDFDNPDIVININYLKDEPNVRIQINPLFIEGRYKKLIRGIPQTKWPCRTCKGRGCDKCNDTGKQYSETVEELISNCAHKMTNSYTSKFHGAGREDIDVRMLGTGRPFVLEIKEPKKREIDIPKLEEKINKYAEGKVEVLNLKYSIRSRKSEIKTSSPDTYKLYKALTILENDIDENKLKKLSTLNIIEQQTPNRVLHRRTNKIRTKRVIHIDYEFINSKEIILIIKGQGGLYIKELISGDDERTQPNISQILNTKATCIELDVLEVGSK